MAGLLHVRCRTPAPQIGGTGAPVLAKLGGIGYVTRGWTPGAVLCSLVVCHLPYLRGDEVGGWAA